MPRHATTYTLRRRTWTCVAAVAICILASNSARGTIREFTMSADAACTGSGSSATGTGTFTLDTETGEVSFDISQLGLTPIQQHIHAPGNTCIEGFQAAGQVILPVGTEVSGTYTLDASLQGLMLQGKHWFMSHTEAHGDGEILGQIIPLCLNECTGNGTCELGVCTCDPGWTGPDCSIGVVIPAVSTWGLIISAALFLTSACVLLRTRKQGLAHTLRRCMSVCIAVVAICFVSSDSALGTLREFTMAADGDCAGTGSSATGTGTFTLNTDTGEVAYSISLVGLTPIGMHIHGPADNCLQALGAASWVFFPTVTELSGTYTLVPYLQALMLQGRHWFNVHTDAHDGGEILGRLIPLCLNDCTDNGTCEDGICTCDPSWTGQDCSIEVVIPAVSTWGLIISALLTLTSASVLLRVRILSPAL